jgi:DNA-binding LytR/AlgR family response regulator
MRVFLVDDEPFSIRRLTFVLKEIPDVEIVGTAGDGHTALSEIRRLKPDLAILDIEMPGINGMAVAEALGNTGPDIVFLTAFDQYATDAFLIEATDYLLKPLKPERLRLAIDRARRRQVSRQAESQTFGNSAYASHPLPQTDKNGAVQSTLHLPNREGGLELPQSEIVWIEAAKDYALIHTSLRSHILRTTMSDLTGKLRPSIIRVHRSAFVAIESVHHWRRSPKGILMLIMTDGSEIPVSPSYVQSVRSQLR